MSRFVGFMSRAAVAATLFAAGCGGSQAEQPASATPRAGAAGGEACADYARQLCLELGARSDACRSALGVIAIMPDSACQQGIAEFATTQGKIAELRQACTAVVERVCEELGEDSASCKAIRGDLPDIPPGHCGALARDQDQLIAMLRQREALHVPLSDERWKELTAGQAPGFGPSDARVVVVQFSDFQCPYCAEAADTVHKLKQQYGTRIRFVFRQFPLSFHPEARVAAQASLAAHDQGKFWEYHDLLFANQSALGQDKLVEHAKAAGLNVASFRIALDASSTAARVDEDLRLGQAAQVQGTPTLFVDKQRIANPLDYEGVSAAVEQALAKSP
jgi:predicted DsbA family dithiol-disulfide isomerase